MAVWPFIMAIVATLTLWGWFRNAWEVPAIALCGYIAMRAIVTYTPEAYIEVAACTSWLFFAAIMVSRGGAIPGFFYTLSALTYPALMVFGFRLHYMGFSPIIAEVFAAFALLSIGGGIYGMADTRVGYSRFLGWLSHHSVGMAPRQGTLR